MPLARTEVEHIAALARIGLTEEEIAVFGEQLASILEQFELLQRLDTSAIAPTGHAVELQSVMREDEPGEPLSLAEALRNVPRREGDFIRVKAVQEE